MVTQESTATRLRTFAATDAGLDTTYLALLAGVCGAYVAAAKLGIELSVAHGVITPVWAPTGIALAALVLFGRRIWPAVALGALIANAISGASLPEAAFISVGNTLEAVVGATLLRRVGFRPRLDRVRDVLALVLLGAVASTTISATNGVTTLWVSGSISGSSYGSSWLLWWIGDGMGDLVVAPLLLVWGVTRLRRPSRAKTFEALALVALLVGVSSFVFLAGYWRYPHLVFPLLIWATLRFRQVGAVTSSFIVAAIAVAGAVNGTTPLGSGSATEVVQILEGLLAAVALSLLILGAVLAERAAADAELERAHANLADAQQVSRIGSWEWNIAKNSIRWSDELYRLFGLEPQSVPLTYESFLEYVHPDDRASIQQAVERAYLDGGAFRVEHRLAAQDGDIRWLEGRGRVVTDASGTPIRMVGTSQDVTERKQLDELRENILSAVSHELRTPLTSVVGFALTLEQQRARLDEHERAEMVTHLAQQAQKLDRLLSDLLDLDRLRRGPLRPAFQTTDIAELVSRIAAAYPADSHPIEVRAEPTTAEVDATKIERVVENLLSNAVKHTPAGTAIQVLVESADGEAVITVADRGPGVLESERQTIFDMFSRGESGLPDAPGTGIGLSLVAQIVSLHAGQAWVEEHPGGGASFRVALPTHQPDTRL